LVSVAKSLACSEVAEEVESIRNSSVRSDVAEESVGNSATGSEVAEELESVGNSATGSEVAEELESVGNSATGSEVAEELESVGNSPARSEVSEELEFVGNSATGSEVAEELESVGNSPARSEVSEELEFVGNSPPRSEVLEVQSTRNSPFQKRKSLPAPLIPKKRTRLSGSGRNKSKAVKTSTTKAKPKATGSRNSPARSKVSEEVESVGNSPARSEVSEELESIRNSPALSEVLEVQSTRNSPFQKRKSLPAPLIPKKRTRLSGSGQNKSKVVKKTPVSRALPKATGSRKKCKGDSCGPPPCSSTCPRWKGDCADWLNSKLVSDDLMKEECEKMGLELSEEERKKMKNNANKFLESMMDGLMDNTSLGYGVFGFKDMVESANSLGVFGEEKLSPAEVKKQLVASVSDKNVKKLAEGIIWPAGNKQDTISSFEVL